MINEILTVRSYNGRNIAIFERVENDVYLLWSTKLVYPDIKRWLEHGITIVTDGSLRRIKPHNPSFLGAIADGCKNYGFTTILTPEVTETILRDEP